VSDNGEAPWGYHIESREMLMEVFLHGDMRVAFAGPFIMIVVFYGFWERIIAV
jgi:hypothetical protein